MSDRWVEAVQAYYDLAKGERRMEIGGLHKKLLDNRGLHPRSIECGRVQALQEMYPEYASARFDPVLIRDQAVKDAHHEFIEKVRKEIREEMSASSRASADDKPVTGRVVGTAGVPEEAAA